MHLGAAPKIAPTFISDHSPLVLSYHHTLMANLAQLTWILLLVFRIRSARSEAIESVGDCTDEEKEGYSSRYGCLLKQATPLRVLYLDAQYIVQNNIAIAKIKSLNKDYVFGKTCGSIDLIPEW